MPTVTSADGFREPDVERQVWWLRRDISPAAGKADRPLATPLTPALALATAAGSPTGGRAVLAAWGAHRYPDWGWDSGQPGAARLGGLAGLGSPGLCCHRDEAPALRASTDPISHPLKHVCFIPVNGPSLPGTSCRLLALGSDAPWSSLTGWSLSHKLKIQASRAPPPRP